MEVAASNKDVEILAFELIDRDDVFADEVAVDGGRLIAESVVCLPQTR